MSIFDETGLAFRAFNQLQQILQAPVGEPIVVVYKHGSHRTRFSVLEEKVVFDSRTTSLTFPSQNYLLIDDGNEEVVLGSIIICEEELGNYGRNVDRDNEALNIYVGNAAASYLNEHFGKNKYISALERITK